MSHFGFKPLDRIIEELQTKYNIRYSDIRKLIDTIHVYIDAIVECDDLLEAGEI